MKKRWGKIFGANTVFQASIMMSFFILISRLLGIVRDRLLAVHFGAGPQLDSFFAAFRLPDFMFNLVVVGSFTAAFIPIYMGLKMKGEEKKAFGLITKATNLLFAVWVVVALIIFLLANYFVHLIAPGFSGAEFTRTVLLTRIMLLSPLFLGLSNVASSTLNSYKRFLLTAIAPCLYNLGIIFGILFLAPRFGVVGVAIGVIVGALLHFMLQWFGLWQLKYRYTFDWNIFTKEVKQIIRLAIPRILTNSIYQLNLWVQTAAASFMLIGSISALNFANNIQGLPVGLVGIALSSAIFPTLTEIALLGNKEEMRHKIIKSLKITLFIIVPLTVFLIVLRAQAVRLILGAGMFTWHDTYVTSQVVGILAISLVAQCFVYLLNQAFFAYHDTRTPLKAAAAAFVLNIVFIVLLAGRSHFSLHWGVDGIALAFTLASITEATVLIVSLRKMIGGFFKDTVRYGFLMLIFSLVAGIFVQITKTYLGSILNLQHTIFVLIQGLVPFVIGAAIFLVLVYFFHVPELAEFNKIKEKLF